MQKENSVIKNYILSPEIYKFDKEKSSYEQNTALLTNFFILYLLFYANIDSCE